MSVMGRTWNRQMMLVQLRALEAGLLVRISFKAEQRIFSHGGLCSFCSDQGLEGEHTCWDVGMDRLTGDPPGSHSTSNIKQSSGCFFLFILKYLSVYTIHPHHQLLIINQNVNKQATYNDLPIFHGFNCAAIWHQCRWCDILTWYD